MSTRCNVIIKDSSAKLIFYRHSDGYPECTLESLREFVKGYSQHMRLDVMQSAGWLILKGREEYSDLVNSSGYNWKIGAYEPTDSIHGDIEFLYTIDLEDRTLTCHAHNGTKKIKKISEENF